MFRFVLDFNIRQLASLSFFLYWWSRLFQDRAIKTGCPFIKVPHYLISGLNAFLKKREYDDMVPESKIRLKLMLATI